MQADGKKQRFHLNERAVLWILAASGGRLTFTLHTDVCSPLAVFKNHSNNYVHGYIKATLEGTVLWYCRYFYLNVFFRSDLFCRKTWLVIGCLNFDLSHLFTSSLKACGRSIQRFVQRLVGDGSPWFWPRGWFSHSPLRTEKFCIFPAFHNPYILIILMICKHTYECWCYIAFMNIFIQQRLVQIHVSQTKSFNSWTLKHIWCLKID